MRHETEKSKKVKDKKESKKLSAATIGKQITGDGLYPSKEKAGIYTIAALSVIGVLLIGYTGVMAMVNSNLFNQSAEGPSIEHLNELLGDLDLEDENETDEEPEVSESSPEEYPEEDEEYEEIEGIPGVITEDRVVFRREPDGSHILGYLDTGTGVIILDMDSNPFWTFILADGMEGYVESNRLEPSSD